MVLQPKFQGKSTHIADDKARIALPSRFRDVVHAAGENAVVVVPPLDESLTGYTVAEFDALSERLSSLAEESQEASELHEYVVGESVTCGLDKQGRFLIPQEMREEVGIVPGSSVTLVGVTTKFRIWNTEVYEARRKGLRADIKAGRFRDLIVRARL
ncbi:MAG: hypothetical protein AB1921_11600 [Thermodesulfobacteriota bacterium]